MERKWPGIFVTFEGPDGCGKTTVIKKLNDYLLGKNKNVVMTREPGGTDNKIAEDIRNILLNKLEYKVDPKTEALLFAASRAQHVEDFILPNLKKGNIVLCDRYIHSSLVYQGIARNMGVEQILKINDFAMNGVVPDITFLLMITPEKGIQRIVQSKQREFNRLDQESIDDLHFKVHEGYKKIAKMFPNQVIEINADDSVENVFNSVLRQFENATKNY